MSEMGYIEATRLPKVTPRIEIIEHKHQKAITRVHIVNDKLDEKLNKNLKDLNRNEKLLTKMYNKEKTMVQDDLVKIKTVKIERTYPLLIAPIAHHSHFRAEEYKHIDKQNLPAPHTLKLSRRPSTILAPVTPPPSVQQIRKIKEDIMDKRNKQVHYNNVAFAHAIAIGNVSGGGWRSLLRNRKSSSSSSRNHSRVQSAVSVASTDIPVKPWRSTHHHIYHSDTSLRVWTNMGKKTQHKLISDTNSVFL